MQVVYKSVFFFYTCLILFAGIGLFFWHCLFWWMFRRAWTIQKFEEQQLRWRICETSPKNRTWNLKIDSLGLGRCFFPWYQGAYFQVQNVGFSLFLGWNSFRNLTWFEPGFWAIRKSWGVVGTTGLSFLLQKMVLLLGMERSYPFETLNFNLNYLHVCQKHIWFGKMELPFKCMDVRCVCRFRHAIKNNFTWPLVNGWYGNPHVPDTRQLRWFAF